MQTKHLKEPLAQNKRSICLTCCYYYARKIHKTKGNAMKSVFLPPQALGLSLDTKQYKKALVYLSRNTLCIYHQVYPSLLC